MAAVALVVALPQVGLLVTWDSWSRHRAAEAALGGMLERAIGEDGATEACRNDPAGWARGFGPRRPRGARRPPPGRERGPPPHRPPGPHVEPPVIEAVADGPLGLQLAVGERSALPTGLFTSAVGVAARTGWGGACDYVVVRGSTAPGFLGSVLPASPVWIAPILLVATVMWLAVGPTVRRIRKLTRDVREGAQRVALDGDDELAELSRAFDVARNALAAEVYARRTSEQALRDFVANTAHDVRIPLTVLQGHLTTLEQGSDPEALKRAMHEAHYLGALLGDLAAHARMDDDPAPVAVELADVVERVVGRHLPIARRAGIELAHGSPGEPVVVRADPTLVEQALSNLVYNAVRHNTHGGHVAVTLDVEGQGFRLAVVDDGPGVAPDELARLTERGYTGTEARGREGQGLGLAIVDRIARQHRWRFVLQESEQGGIEAVLSGPIAS